MGVWLDQTCIFKVHCPGLNGKAIIAGWILLPLQDIAGYIVLSCGARYRLVWRALHSVGELIGPITIVSSWWAGIAIIDEMFTGRWLPGLLAGEEAGGAYGPIHGCGTTIIRMNIALLDKLQPGLLDNGFWWNLVQRKMN